MKQILYAFLLLMVLNLSLMAGPLSALYVTQWYNGNIAVIQGNQIINQWARSGNGEISIAVSDTVKTFGHSPSSPYNVGAQYTLNGTYTGTQYVKTSAVHNYTWDGTTDGQYNYTIDHYAAGSYAAGGVYRYDSNWSNPVHLFSTGQNDLSITYDPTNDSFWVSSWGAYTVRNYSRSGSLLSSFSTPYSHISALALDHADNTLWFTQGSNTFYQYSKSGTALSSVTISGITGNVYGAEFAYSVPEPAGLFFLGLAIAVFSFLRKK
ncbi:MAG: PEP-CTERM sorting domain-containing protein [Candidatus Brocadiae bacterium]|nr:PEP-CTERM sorting domain-containing protein [Candidatus Brocadiia bacterium]